MTAMTVVTAVAVEEVHHRTTEQQKNGQILEHVSAVLADQEKRGNEDESPEDPAARATSARPVLANGISCHGHPLLQVPTERARRAFPGTLDLELERGRARLHRLEAKQPLTVVPPGRRAFPRGRRLPRARAVEEY